MAEQTMGVLQAGIRRKQLTLRMLGAIWWNYGLERQVSPLSTNPMMARNPS